LIRDWCAFSCSACESPYRTINLLPSHVG
jgi:hypothetical protein